MTRGKQEGTRTRRKLCVSQSFSGLPLSMVDIGARYFLASLKCKKAKRHNGNFAAAVRRAWLGRIEVI